MPPVARWRPTTPPEGWRKSWGWLTDVPAGIWGKFGLVLALAAFMVWLGVSHGKPFWMVLGNAALPLYLFGVLLKGEAILRPHSRLRRRLRAASPRSTYPVRMTLLRDDVPYGQDDGMASFENGSLRYDGVRTAFQLAPRAVAVPENGLADGPLMRDGANWRYDNLADGSA